MTSPDRNSPVIVIEPTKADATRRAAAEIARRLTSATESNGVASVAFSGGNTPRGMLRSLAASAVDWTAVDIFQVDERVVPKLDPDRNWQLIREELLEPAEVPRSRWHPMPVGVSNLIEGAIDYGRLVSEKCPHGLSVVHLGLGDDGHTASWPPGDRVLQATDQVAIVPSFRGHTRMTVTPPLVNGAADIVWLVTDEPKSAPLRALVSGQGHLPAHAVRRSPHVLVVADLSAAGALADESGARRRA